MAVRKSTRAQILSEFERRLQSDVDSEFAACLAQIDIIARLRLDAMLPQ